MINRLLNAVNIRAEYNRLLPQETAQLKSRADSPKSKSGQTLSQGQALALRPGTEGEHSILWYIIGTARPVPEVFARTSGPWD